MDAPVQERAFLPGVTSLIPEFRRMLGGLVDLAFPPRCADCGAWLADPLCEACLAKLEPELQGGSPRYLDACVAGAAYAGRTPYWMQRFKYPGTSLASLDPAAVAVACSLAIDAAHLAASARPDAVVPVPLYPRRLRERGFNPAALLARAVARDLGAHYQPAALERRRDTPSQTGLDRRGRRRNVRGAFTCNGPAPRRVWLVDDVVTTGATLSECARALRKAGSRYVVGVCAARTPRQWD